MIHVEICWKFFFFLELNCRETSILNLLQPNLQESFVSNDELFHLFFFECSNCTFSISYYVFLSDLKFEKVSIIPNRTFDWMANVKKLWVKLLFPQRHYLLVTAMPRLYCSHSHSYKAAKVPALVVRVELEIFGPIYYGWTLLPQ